MTVAVLIPWRGGDPHRERALEWVTARYRATFDVDVILGESPPGPFNRSVAILDAASQTTADVVIVADGDAWCDGTTAAVDAVRDGAPWAVPHSRIYRLTPEATVCVLDGGRCAELEEPPYSAFPCGLVHVMRRDVLLDVPPDIRFEGWGGEERAWSLALDTLYGGHWRGNGPAIHLWHPPQPRLSRNRGNEANERLVARYRRAVGRPEQMRALLAEPSEPNRPSRGTVAPMRALLTAAVNGRPRGAEVLGVEAERLIDAGLARSVE